MNKEEFNETDELETLETTKEVGTLKDLSIAALNNIEQEYNEYQNEFDDQMNDSDLIFKTVVNTKEELQKENQEDEPIIVEDDDSSNKKNKKNLFKNLKDKWNSLTKKKKILIISGIILLLILISVGLFFLLKKDKTLEKNEPDVILMKDNYKYENGKLVFFENDKELGTYECENKDENLCKMADVNNSDNFLGPINVDEKGEKLVVPAKIYKERFVFIVDHKDENDKSIKLYDLFENKTLKTVFDLKSYDEYADYVVLKNEESLYGLEKFSDDKLETVIPYNYDSLGILPNQEEIKLISVRKDNNYYLTDLNNKILTKAFTSPIVAADDKHVVLEVLAKTYDVYDYNASQVTNKDYDYVTLLSDVLIYVINNQLFVSDYEGNLMSYEGLALKNQNYNPKLTYEEYKLVKTEKAYDYELNNNILNINIYNGDDFENYSINLSEGKLSSKLAFMSYFKGNLYFYADEKKETLIGSYPCTNHNEVDSNSSTLNNCKLANDSFFAETIGNNKEKDQSKNVGAIPLINKQFVFVSDGDKIVLYDLINKKELATYESVDTSSYTSMNSLSFVNTNQLMFIAKSKSSGKFGIASINSSEVVPVLSFDFKSIKKLGKYYVVESDNGYALYDAEGEKITADKNSSIVDYLEVDSTHKYLKTYKDGMYFVHTYDKEVSSNSYNYIELYDEYYAAVLNNKVHVYDYNNKEVTITEENDSGLTLNITNYYGEGTKAFRVTFDSENVYVEIGNSNNTYTDKVGFPKVKESD